MTVISQTCRHSRSYLSAIILSALLLHQCAIAALIATNFWPASGTSNICPDTPLRITFDGTPTVNSIGLIRVYTVAGELIDTIDLSLSAQSRLIGGVVFTNFAVIVSGNTASIFPHTGAITNNQSYYVTVGATVFSGSSGAYAGITNATTWQFSTKPAPPADGTNYLVVAADGSGDFTTVQGAIEFLPTGNTNHTLLFIRNGLYQEIIYVTNKNNLTFRGEDRAQTVIAYANNVNLNSSSATTYTNLYRQLFAVDANDVALENLTLSNSTPHGGGQAEALRIDGQRCIINHASFHSYQDTLKVSGTVYFNDSYVEGDTDFIWGFGTTYFTNCELKALNAGHNTQSRSDTNHYGYVFVNCSVTKASSLGANTHDLGRYISASHPLSDYGHVAYVNCKMDTHIKAAGWGSTVATVRYWEYQSVMMDGVTPVNTSSRVSPSRQITATEAAWMRDPTIVFGLITNGVPVGSGWSPQLAPNILAAPTNQIINSNQTATFTVSATGIPAPTLQWRKNDTDIAGETNMVFTVTNARPADTAIYSCIASNLAGIAKSDVATLTVSPLPPVHLDSIIFDNNSIVLQVSGNAGPSYTLQTSTNLTLWSELFTTNAAQTSFTWSNTISGDSTERYYRVVAVPPAH